MTDQSSERVSGTVSVVAQRAGGLTAEQIAQRWRTETDLQSLAIVERKVMTPMRDGVRLATDIYRPKNAGGKVPAIFADNEQLLRPWPSAPDRGLQQQLSTF